MGFRRDALPPRGRRSTVPPWALKSTWVPLQASEIGFLNPPNPAVVRFPALIQGQRPAACGSFLTFDRPDENSLDKVPLDEGID